MPLTDRVREADAYLAARTGCYELRCQRYDAALAVMHRSGLDDRFTVIDVGSGWGEFGARMHTGTSTPVREDGSFDMPLPWVRARYIPVDACIDGVDLDDWVPPRRADWFVCLEVIEHLDAPRRLLSQMQGHADRGVIVSTPNPETTDVLGMDSTHRTPVDKSTLEDAGFTVTERSFYGQSDDSLFGVWLA